jgi:peptidoglycan hydrolase-like protein with peptidoglycan-binding domain
MAKLIITESERLEISSMYGLINEQLGGVAKSVLLSAESAVLKIPSIAKLGFKNIDEVIGAMSRLTARQKGEVFFTLFKNTKGQGREQIAIVFTNSQSFVNRYLKSTEEATRAALKRSGKYADDEIEVIVNAHKKNTGSAKWSNQLRKPGKYAQLGDDIQRQIESITRRDYQGKQFSTLGQGSREKVIREALMNSSRRFGFTISQESKEILRTVLKRLGLTTAAIAGLLGITSLFTGDSTNTSDDGSTNGGETIPENWMDGILNKEWTLMSGSHNQTGYDNIDEAIKTFQRVLRVEDDGKFGPMTKKAVEDFQRDNNISIDGIIGDETLNKMIENGLINEN